MPERPALPCAESESGLRAEIELLREAWLVERNLRHDYQAKESQLREQIAWTVRRCNDAMGDGFNGTPNSAVSAVCDQVERLRDTIARGARMAESERAGMVLQILRESA